MEVPAGTSFQLTGRKKHLQPLAVQGPASVQETSQAVTAFSGGHLEDDKGKAAAPLGKLVIPKLDNTFQAGPQRHDPARYLPDRSDAVPSTQEERFEQAKEQPEVKVEYGLQQRQRPLQPAQQQSQENFADIDTRRFKEDLSALPDTADAEAYASMPIENFGEAMLRGMGWTEGRAVCKREKKEVQATTYVRRPEGLGLGAKPALAEPSKKRTLKPGDSNVPKQDLVYMDSSGKERSVRPLDAKLTQRQAAGPQPGKRMHLLSGRHQGLACQVLALEAVLEGHSAKASVRLLQSQQTVTVRVKELAETWELSQPQQQLASHHQPPEPRQSAARAPDGQAHSLRNGHGTSQPSSSKTSHPHPEVPPANGHSNHKRHKPSHADEQAASHAQPKPISDRSAPWLAEHIVVKVIDKHMSRGRLYLQKAEIIDVQAPTVCSIHFAATNETVDSVQQDQLETVVPRKEGARVLILSGSSRGQKAWLLKRNSESSAAAVRPTMDPDTIIRLSFDAISEYVGALGEEE